MVHVLRRKSDHDTRFPEVLVPVFWIESDPAMHIYFSKDYML